MHANKAQDCMHRNNRTGIYNMSHFWATNGRDQAVLDEWYLLTDTKRLNVSDFAPGFKEGPENPHVVGCYLSHWRLLQQAQSFYTTHQTLQTRPDALVILEDDAACVDNLDTYLQETIPKLPSDWDFFMIGGKPFSELDRTFDDGTSKIDKPEDTFQSLACQGFFGRSSTGPFAPDGSRRIDPKRDDYWKTGYMTNTHAYVVNPKRLEHILHVLKTATDNNGDIVPIDMVYGDAMHRGVLQAFMPTQEYCAQQTHALLKSPRPWEGFYYHPQWKKGAEWGPMYYKECPARDQGLF
ncbi:MAG: hypothetical protein SGARI_006219 [Bacillariaceae sp.]